MRLRNIYRLDSRGSVGTASDSKDVVVVQVALVNLYRTPGTEIFYYWSSSLDLGLLLVRLVLLRFRDVSLSDGLEQFLRVAGREEELRIYKLEHSRSLCSVFLQHALYQVSQQS